MGLESFGSYEFECLETDELQSMESDELSRHMREVYRVMMEGVVAEAHRRVLEEQETLERLRRVKRLLADLKEQAESLEDEYERALNVIAECERRIDAQDTEISWFIAWQLNQI